MCPESYIVQHGLDQSRTLFNKFLGAQAPLGIARVKKKKIEDSPKFSLIIPDTPR